MMDELIVLSNGESVVLTEADLVEDEDHCDTCLDCRIAVIVEDVVDEMVFDRVFAILDGIFGEDS